MGARAGGVASEGLAIYVEDSLLGRVVGPRVVVDQGQVRPHSDLLDNPGTTHMVVNMRDTPVCVWLGGGGGGSGSAASRALLLPRWAGR